MSKFYERTVKLFGPINRAWHNYHFEGVQNVPMEGANIVAIGGHDNLIDVIHLPLTYPRELRFLANEKFIKVPIIGGLLRKYETIPVNFTKLGLKTLRTTLDYLEQEEGVGIFFEGKLWKSDKAPKKGLAYIALKAVEKGINLKITPVSLTGTYRMYPAGFIPFLKTIKMKVGENIDPSKYSSVDELTDDIWSSIVAMQ